MDYTIGFDAPTEKIYQDFTSREYWQTLMDSYRFLTPQSEITRFRSDERGTDITIKQNLPRMYLPPVARAVSRIGPFGGSCIECRSQRRESRPGSG